MPDTAFRPSLHGYKFSNSWRELPPLPPLPRPLPQVPREFSAGYGLCGGMALGARDEFITNRPIAPDTATPPAGSALFNHIWAKQLRSFGAAFSYIGDFIVGMALPDITALGVRKRSHDAAPAIRAEIDRGRPALIGQIKVSARSSVKLWENHQVLAWGYTVSATTLTLKIYDPNYPGRDDVDLVCRRVSVGRTTQWRKTRFGVSYPWYATAWGYEIFQRTPGYQRPSFPVRGIFHMPV